MIEQQLSKKLMCIVVRGGIEIWLEKDRIKKLSAELLSLKENRLIEIEGEGEMVNTADMVGIFTPQTMEDSIRRKNGQWKDRNGKWHNRGDRVCHNCSNVVPFGMKCGNCG